ncbi:LacI family DNA-binding transcriptional regulator [Neorhizobium sp. NCHU2750]|uniref:LacI family DNA-binding transcriptional regulator n=1 Tax=Neorhizobium sp. NCHU2750 TaxID=1825976 RepID=UPI000EB755BB|nr:LacI family transcriptional regulator [Neorhizobium sp. NCHU2750]
MKKGSVTLEDVARAAGLSRAQVSRALRGDPGVTPATREMAETAARRLGYRPNLAARTLASAQSRSVGIVIGEPLNPFHMLLAQALDERLAANGFDSIVSLRAINDQAVLRESDRLLSMRAQGVFLISTPESDEAIAALANALPSVFMGRQLQDLNVSSVSADDEDASARAIEHLIDLGHRRIAHIEGGSKPGAIERKRGYQRAMAQADLPIIEVSGEHDIDSGRRGVAALLDNGDLPTAIFADNDLTAIGAINELRRRGTSVPQDISVIGFDDIPASGTETISLTTVRQDAGSHAAAAVELMDGLLAEPDGAREFRVVESPLIIRRSTASPASRNR